MSQGEGRSGCQPDRVKGDVSIGHLEKSSFPDAGWMRFKGERRCDGAGGQLGFFDLRRRYEGLDRKKDPLVTLAAVVPWESFRAEIEATLARQDLRAPVAERKSAAGRKPWDAVLIFKTLVVQALYNLS